ncbi:hypothetical protein Tdes44962_MAKER04709 [Teratosphaeria destructans]|uniref:Uncharacterized protein n=1 Tax=Teratosphaeria destructans TaxID=418781 RepID=A0A9W7SLM0_9PEZI|nr:hypothetical protein Tdes44962_MAKER04709 [Teratosphaeria destructans]
MPTTHNAAPNPSRKTPAIPTAGVILGCKGNASGLEEEVGDRLTDAREETEPVVTVALNEEEGGVVVWLLFEERSVEIGVLVADDSDGALAVVDAAVEASALVAEELA